MTLIITKGIHMIIEKEKWEKCSICNSSIESISSKYGGGGTYRTKSFIKHLQLEHNITIDEYFNFSIICPCGVCGKKLGVKYVGANFYLKMYACGRNSGVLKWSLEAKESRAGSKNPMYGKKPWNQSLTKESSESLMIVSKKMTGRAISDETRLKQKESAKKRKIHGHTGHKHSEECKNKLRLNTLDMIKNGKYNHIDTLPVRVFQSILTNENISFEKEKIVSHWSFDFYLYDHDLYIEIDGDYFHSNPLLYPEGPKTKTQKINNYRDKKKNTFCKENNIKLIRFWEYDILRNKECVQQRLLELIK